MNLKSIIGMCVSLILLINLFIYIFIRKAIMLADFPINYKMHELDSFFFLVLLTSFLLVVFLLFSDRFLKINVGILVLITAYRTFIYYKHKTIFKSNMINDLNEYLIWMFLFPLIIGLVLLITNNRPKVT
ncbi:hypothetical protein [uncultured Psychrobacillus sp.]|uniref:hypothetical protein n=1 Tax=uncultured Psychrobacillus sp. TaxID=1551585 RepID=UPI00262EC882|nr:hypothetical protein [uncultured Psychrobacillus sp.]